MPFIVESLQCLPQSAGKCHAELPTHRAVNKDVGNTPPTLSPTTTAQTAVPNFLQKIDISFPSNTRGLGVSCCDAELPIFRIVNQTQPTPSTITTAQFPVQEFLQKIGISFPTYTRDPELEAHVKAIVQCWDSPHVHRAHVITALILTTTAYSHIPSLAARVQITLFTTLVIALDDPAVLEALDSRAFHLQTCTGEVQREHGLLGEFARLLGGMWEHYAGFAANTIYASALRFVNVAILESETDGMALHAGALSFVEYKRSMSATTEAYACFIWDKSRFPDVKVYMQAIPDAMLYVSFVNDIFSFHKEELAGETGNYIHERASVTGKSAAETLHEVISDTIAAVRRVREILGEGEARDAFENFAAGGIRMHIGDPRYRLNEIIAGEYLIDMSDFVL